MAIEFTGQTYIGGKRFRIQMDRERIGVVGWLALQGIGFAVMLVGDIVVAPVDDEGES